MASKPRAAEAEPTTTCEIGSRPRPKTVRVDLGYLPRKWQVECHKLRRRFNVLALHRRAGKTEMAIRHLYHEAVKPSEHSMRLYIYMAPFLKQAKLIAWDRMRAIAKLLPGAVVNESELCVKLPNGAELRVFGGDNPDAIRGVRLDGAVIDEVAQIKPEVWNEIVQPALSDRLGWALFIGTPKGINMFSELYHKAKNLPDWFSRSYTVYDTDALDPDEVARLKRDMPDNEFRREYLCDFSAAAEDQLISVSTVEEAAQRHLRSDQYDTASLVLGCDPARFGDDCSVIVLRQGLKCEDPISFKGLDNMELASRVANIIEQRRPDAVFIDVGNGSGVIDRLRQLGFRVIEVNFGSKPTDARFVNKRTEMWCNVKEWLGSGGALPNHQKLKQDLATPTYHFNEKNQTVLETKDEIKKRLTRSPDDADALALTFAFDVSPQRNVTAALQRPAARRTLDYDPLA